MGGGAALLGARHGLRPAWAGDDLPASPRLTPFLTPLPVPPDAQPVAAFPLLAAPTSTDFPDGAAAYIGGGTTYHRIVEEQRQVRVHPHLPPTWFWGYRDAAPGAASPWPSMFGPTIRMRAAGTTTGRGTLIRVTNNLPTPANSRMRFGLNHTTTHFHGGHHAGLSDGFPTNIDVPGGPRTLRGPGDALDHMFPMLDPGFSHGRPEAHERGSTLWYHDHCLHFTAQNVMTGLAGLVLVSDELDANNENLNDGRNLRLPSGAFDVPLVIQDRRIDTGGQLVYNALDHDGFLGDTWFVNGVVQPFLEVQRRKYRFRLLNGSNARYYKLYVNDARGNTVPFDMIANEGGLFSRPIRGMRSFTVSPAERIEFVVDFRSFADGTRLFLENRLEQDNGRKPEGEVARGPQLMEFRVRGSAPAADPSRVPDVLRPFAAISAAEIRAATRRSFKFERNDGMWSINGLFFDETRPIATPRLNGPEIWRLESGGGWAHPVHIHLEYFRVLTRDGKLPALHERDGIAKKDTISIGADFKDVEVYINFRDFAGAFVFHCHNLEHEDMDMMARITLLR